MEYGLAQFLSAFTAAASEGHIRLVYGKHLKN